MENAKLIKPNKNTTAFDSVRIRPQSKIRFNKVLSNANKKNFGEKIIADELFALMLDRVTTEDIQLLQSKSLRNADRIELLRQAYVKAHGQISEDDFLGFTLTPEFPEFLNKYGREIVPGHPGSIELEAT